MDYYYKLQKPNEFRYLIMSAVKESLLLQKEQEKLDLIRQAKKDLFEEIETNSKELETLISKLEIMLTDDDLKKEILKEIEQERDEQKKIELKKTNNYQETQVSKNTQTKKQEKSKSKEILETIKEKPKQKENTEMNSFEYTLDKIEQKLAKLRED